MRKLLIPIFLFLAACQYPCYKSVFKIANDTMMATAFAVGEHEIITNNHVAKDGGVFTLLDVDGNVFSATVVRCDPEHDLCLLTTRKKLTPIPISIKPPRIGQKVIVAGAPDGIYLVVATGRVGSADNVFQIPCRNVSAPTYSGSSGSAVFDSQGNLIGVIFAFQVETHTGFFVSSKYILKLLEGAKK